MNAKILYEGVPKLLSFSSSKVVKRQSHALSSTATVTATTVNSLSTVGKTSLFSTASGDNSGFDTVGCVGLGLMGHGICQVAASSGIHSRIVAFEKEQKFLDAGYVIRDCTHTFTVNGVSALLWVFSQNAMFFFLCSRDRIVKSLDKLVEKGKLTLQYANDTLGRIEFTTDLDALKETDFIVEAIIENMDLKEDLYTQLGELCKPETIFASNTSSLSIAEMAAFSGRPEKFVGVHFFNPVQVGKMEKVSYMYRQTHVPNSVAYYR